MKFVFVILHYRDVTNTKACIDSLCKMKLVKDLEVLIFVIDNLSPDPYPKDTIACVLGEVIIIRNEQNLGYSGGMNSGIKLAMNEGADFVCVVNNDTVFDTSFLQSMMHTITQKKKEIFVD